jgi:signal transduction histidine kinase
VEVDNNALTLAVIYFFYGLAFFSMGFAIILEGGRSSDDRLRLALRPLAGFGLIHGAHEWVEMFTTLGVITEKNSPVWIAIELMLLAFSFLSLSGFGFSLLTPNIRLRRISLLAPLAQATIWGFGLLVLKGRFPTDPNFWHIADVWSRYTLGVPAAISASVGLIAQQRTFRRAGMAEFGRDSLIAAVAFAWYGLIGQVFVRASRLPPSTFINQDLFFYWFRIPVQLLRGTVAIIVAIYVIRFMRAFDTEIKRQISALQAMRLQEAKRREELRGDLLRRVVAAQEAERQRIARELHDETGQTLTAIGLGLRGITTSLNKNPSQAEQNLRKLENLASSSLDELQRIITNLRPTHLDDLGLSAALRWYLGEVRSHTDIEINFDVQGVEMPLPDAIRIAIFRMVQEAVTNVIKHAGAASAHVELTYYKDDVMVRIEDNGRGMDLKDVEKDRKSWGLLGMRERCALLEGKFEIDSTQGEGVNILISIPCRRDELVAKQTIEVTDAHSTDSG